MQPTTVANVPSSTYAQEAVQKEAKAQSVPTDKVDRIPSSTSNLSVRREETPMRKKASLRLKSAELSEESDRVAELLDSADELVNSFSQAKDVKTAENLSEKNEQIRRRLEFIQQKLTPEIPEESLMPDPEAIAQESPPETPRSAARPEEKVVFETSKESKALEEQAFFEVNLEANNIRQEAAQAEQEQQEASDSNRKRIKAASEDEAVRMAERSEDGQENRADQAIMKDLEKGRGKGEVPEDEKVIGELIEDIRQKLIMRTNRREEAYRATTASNRREQIREAGEETGAADPNISGGSEEKLIVERQNLERIKEKTSESVRELVSELAKTPVETLSRSSYRELNSLLDKTLKDIQENRDSLNELKVRHDEIEQSKELSGPSREIPALDHREAERIAFELTREPPVNQLKRVQQRITPDAVSQLLF